MFAIIAGTPIEGEMVTGPFADAEAAIEYAAKYASASYWWAVPLAPPEEAPSVWVTLQQCD